ncbi:MAG: heme d1 biosynthesis radical SAM protein NirJ [Alphaproteobacteria bacterium]|nr:heme d1 biosynthesis radical SAM protein NirJ [Alphaproteobacteria bacterium]
MFRLSQFVGELFNPTPPGPHRDLAGPVVVWNLIRRCNLTCQHCYALSADKDFPNELSTEEAFRVMDDLYASGTRVLILSGGEPMLRPDLFEISRRAKEMGFYVALSTNGTLIDADSIGAIAAVGYSYVGISIDGRRDTHDRFRRRTGAFEASLAGLRLCRDAGIKIGLRFTLTSDNAADLPWLLDLMEEERIDKFYLSHLNYAGRGRHAADVLHAMTRQAIDLLIERCVKLHVNGTPKEFVTGNNDADGPYFLRWVRVNFPDRAEHIRAKLVQWGGNASGVNVANIDNQGNVHPDTMWWHTTLGNVRTRSFSTIWRDTSDPLMAGLKTRPRPVKGRCGTCEDLDICGGNTRVRAHQLTGDPWAEDPACHLIPEGVRGRPASPALTLLLACLFPFLSPNPVQAENTQALYATHCASCHAPDRLGGMGPALFPESLGHMRSANVASVIAAGRPSTQMPGFSAILTPPEIESLAALVLSPLPAIPAWGLDDMRKTHVVTLKDQDLVAKPAYSADPLNLFTVVEAGDHHITILDGDKFEPLTRFASHFAVHGGAKYSPDGRFVYLASRDGWISKYDLYGLKMVAEIRAGVNTRNIAVSSDGRFVMVGNMLPHTLVLLDAHDLTPMKIIAVNDGKGHESRVSAVYTAPPRNSFIVALKDLPEVWEVSYTEDHAPIYSGTVHSFEKGQEEALGVQTGLFAVRRIGLDTILDDFFFDQTYVNLLGAGRGEGKGQVVNLIVGRKVADLNLSGMPHLGSGITFLWQGQPVMATPNLKENVISVIDMTTWKTIKRIPTLGPGYFLRGHENSPYIWADVFNGPHKDSVHVIDTRTLEIVKTLCPEPGKTAAHVEFTRDGRYALLSIWEDDGAIIVYNAATLEEIKRIPMRKPVGKYNVWNKVHYSSGTSH